MDAQDSPGETVAGAEILLPTMSTSPTSDALQVVHRPTGIDHPYEPFFDERRPRDPSGGDMVALGFLTRPGGLATEVRVDWTRNGRRQTPIFARALDLLTDEDRWLVELGVVEASDEVEYRIIATGRANETAVSGPHRFTTRQWHTGTTLHGDGDGATLTVTDTRTGARLILRAEEDSAGARLSLMSSRTSGIEWALPRAREGTGPSLTPAPYPDDIPLSVPEGLPSLSPGFLTPGDPASTLLAPHDGSDTLPTPGDPAGMIEVGDGASLLLNRDSHPPLPLTVRWQTEGHRITALELTAPLTPDEALVGFGERFDALDQRGRAVDTVVYEQYKNQGNRTYLPVPFFLSSEGYSLLVEGAAPVDFDLGKTVPNRWRCLAQVPERGELAIRVLSGTPDDIVRSMTAATGRPEPLPAWAYGLWMSSNEWNTQARVENEVAQTIKHGISATVLVIEAWSDESTFYIWNGAEYTPRPGGEAPRLSDFRFPESGPWPDPAAMTRQLHEQGIRLVLWQIPALKALDAPHPQHDADVAHALERRYVLQDEDGSPYRNPFFWFRGAHIPDFTSEEASAWWLGKRAYLLDEAGIDGFKTDGGEHLAGRGLRASDGRRGDELVNAYPNLYVGAYHRFAKERRGGDALTFSRAGHTGAGTFPAHWAGDENSTWEAYRRSIVAGLTAGLSGVIFWSWDLAGFSDALPTAELYLRSAAMAAFCPIMQYHSEYNPSGPSRDRTPWNIAAHTGDERVIPLLRHFARVRMNLLPYLVEEGRYAAEAGTPFMRPLLLDWPENPTCWTITDQYLLGRSLLAAPIVEEGATSRTLYLPAGKWVDLWDGTPHAGSQWLTVEAPWDRIPVFAKAGSEIPLRLTEGGWLGSDTGNGLDLETGVIRWRAGTDRIPNSSK